MSPAKVHATDSSIVFDHPLYLDRAGSAHFRLDDGRHVAARPGAAKMEPTEKDMIMTRVVSAPEVGFARNLHS